MDGSNTYIPSEDRSDIIKWMDARDPSTIPPSPTHKAKYTEGLGRRGQIMAEMSTVQSIAGCSFTGDHEMEVLYDHWLKAGRPANSMVCYAIVGGERRVEVAEIPVAQQNKIAEPVGEKICVPQPPSSEVPPSPSTIPDSPPKMKMKMFRCPTCKSVTMGNAILAAINCRKDGCKGLAR